MVAKSKNLKEERGQAIFEMLIFMPILILMYTIIFNVGNALNIAINQQKVLRRYYYYLIKGNSLIPTQDDLQERKENLSRMGMSVVGYADQKESDEDNAPPIGSCFKFNTIAAGSSDETCVDVSDDENETIFVRVYSAYGICGENYRKEQNIWIPTYSAGPGNPDPKSKPAACTNSSGGGP